MKYSQTCTVGLAKHCVRGRRRGFDYIKGLLFPATHLYIIIIRKSDGSRSFQKFGACLEKAFVGLGGELWGLLV